MAKILIVEDNPVTARMLARTMEKAGHEYRLATAGREALDIDESNPADLIVMDYLLPDTNGLDLLNKFLDRDPQKLVVMVTGAGDEELAVDVMKAGARDYFVKSGRFFNSLILTVDRVIQEEKMRRELVEKAKKSERLSAQNELTYWMAHNFKNILSGAIGYLALLELGGDQQPAEKRKEYLKEAADCLNQALYLMDQLLNLTNIDPGLPEQVRIFQLVQESRTKISEQLTAADRTWPEFEFINKTESLPDLHLSVKDCRLILDCLIRNAVEALNKPGRIVIDAEVDQNVLTIRVSDDGRGMDEETLKKALEPLFSTKGAVGVGLGLSLVQAALRRHGGELALESAPGKGACVTIKWPLVKN